MARPATIADDDLLVRLKLVFRAGGYEAASLVRLAAETGLAKAALYHRFPQGKEGMALAVARQTSTQMRVEIFEPLAGPGSPRAKIEAMVAALDSFYFGGRESCFVELFSIEGVPEAIREVPKANVKAWIEALAGAIMEAGFTSVEGYRRAEEGVLRIEGALVLSRALGDNGPFQRVLNRLAGDLLAEPQLAPA
jgi:TetR/AcrR family transcriptional repressor of lmrAB and yxaGH operons